MCFKILQSLLFVSSFCNLFCQAEFLPYGISDHSPVLITYSDGYERYRKSFRFMNYLASKKEFITVLRDKWFEPFHGCAMYVLVKRMKFMKKHLRDLNRANGDVFDKVKNLKIELDRVQCALDKDSSNSVLREE